MDQVTGEIVGIKRLNENSIIKLKLLIAN